MTGVYLIQNLLDGKLYIGSATVSLQKRFVRHRRELRAGTHANPPLQRAWSKYGEQCFSFAILEECSAAECLGREQFWIDTKCSEGVRLYNLCPRAGNPGGRKHSAEAIEKLRIASTGRKHTAETKTTMRLAWTRRTDAEQARAQLRSGFKGRRHSQASRALMGRSRVQSPETRQKIRAAITGKKRSEETKAKIGLASRLRRRTPEASAKASATMKAVWQRKKLELTQTQKDENA